MIERVNVARNDHGRYVVMEGDTIESVAVLFGTTVDALALTNGIAADQPLELGTTLRVATPTGYPETPVDVLRSLTNFRPAVEADSDPDTLRLFDAIVTRFRFSLDAAEVPAWKALLEDLNAARVALDDGADVDSALPQLAAVEASEE